MTINNFATRDTPMINALFLHEMDIWEIQPTASGENEMISASGERKPVVKAIHCYPITLKGLALTFRCREGFAAMCQDLELHEHFNYQGIYAVAVAMWHQALAALNNEDNLNRALDAFSKFLEELQRALDIMRTMEVQGVPLFRAVP